MCCVTEVCDVLSEHTGQLYDKDELLSFFKNHCKLSMQSINFMIDKHGAKRYQEKTVAALEAKGLLCCSC
ncbi:hypothetical protein B484DRAFT_404002 [Ochromonadaceae sp. CCMP2298]|nr:hypothetical protein B484DRAFT_404002 [Ochromonadaceae sp. CCMP2298]